MGRDQKTSYLLVLNAGSATLKWALYTSPDLEERARGVVERIGSDQSFAESRISGRVVVNKDPIKTHEQALARVLKMIAWHLTPLDQIILVAHRLVHGGEQFFKPTRLTVQVIRQLAKFRTLAPLHNPLELLVVKHAARFLPYAKQWAVFDTAYFHDLPDYNRYYALSPAFQDKHQLRRFGFHGISHHYVAERAASLINRPLAHLNLITCHLGSGGSVTLVRQGRVIDTSMGFTPLEGLMMDTRSGDIDPGLVLYLIQELKMKLQAVKTLLYDNAGLKGVAGTEDMREVLVRAGFEVLGYKPQAKVSRENKAKASLALRMYLWRLQKYLGAYAALLGKVDAIVFTGGIGERNETIRNLVMRGLPTLKDIPILVIATNEELAIARQVVKITPH